MYMSVFEPTPHGPWRRLESFKTSKAMCRRSRSGCNSFTFMSTYQFGNQEFLHRGFEDKVGRNNPVSERARLYAYRLYYRYSWLHEVYRGEASVIKRLLIGKMHGVAYNIQANHQKMLEAGAQQDLVNLKGESG